jgi:CelD/BcsL family acetyltransferase involved in cellulose biosynthesis
MSTLTTQIIRDPGTLAVLSGEWWSLWRRAPYATPFQSPAWLMPWWDVFAPGQLASIAIRQDNRLVAFAPLYLETGALGLRLLPLGIGTSDYLDVLIDPDCEEGASKELMATIPRLAPWEICEFTELTANATALKLPSPVGLSAMMSDASEASVLPIPATARDLRDCIPMLRWRQLRLAQNRAAHRGEMAIVVGDADNSAALLRDLARLQRARANRRVEAGGPSDKQVVQFHAAALPGLIAADLARLYALMIGDKMASVYYGFLDRERAYAYLHGYNPSFAHENPGLIVMAYAIEQAVKEGAREFHFQRDDEHYKFEWGASHRRNKLRMFVRDSATVPPL